MPRKKKNTDVKIPMEMQVYDKKCYVEMINDLLEQINEVETFLFEDQCDIGRANLLVSLGELFAVAKLVKRKVSNGNNKEMATRA